MLCQASFERVKVMFWNHFQKWYEQSFPSKIVVSLVLKIFLCTRFKKKLVKFNLSEKMTDLFFSIFSSFCLFSITICPRLSHQNDEKGRRKRKRSQFTILRRGIRGCRSKACRFPDDVGMLLFYRTCHLSDYLPKNVGFLSNIGFLLDFWTLATSLGRWELKKLAANLNQTCCSDIFTHTSTLRANSCPPAELGS